MKIEFFHQCQPPTATAQQRQFFSKGKTALTPAAKKAAATWQAIVEPHRPDEPMTGAIEVSIMLTWERKRQVLIESKTTKPDLDNIAKLILDAMTKAGYWVDDAQVSRLQLEKFWGELPGVLVKVIEEGASASAQHSQIRAKLVKPSTDSQEI